MLKIKTSFLAFSLAAALGHSATALPAQAAEITGLRDFVQKQLSTTQAELNASAEAPPGSEREWFFRRIWLRIRPQITFTVPTLAHIQVIPEVEILFERTLPAGTSVYKP